LNEGIIIQRPKKKEKHMQTIRESSTYGEPMGKEFMKNGKKKEAVH
jgi:hypothetical protein